MKLLAVCQSKGGVGKSLLAIQSAAYLSTLGKTLLINADQGSMTSEIWYDGREDFLGDTDPNLRFSRVNTDRDLSQKLTQAARRFEYAVVDTHQQISNLHRYLAENADLVLTPIDPLKTSIDSAAPMLQLMRDYKANYTVVFNQHDGRYAMQQQVIEEAQANPPFNLFHGVIKRRASYQRATALGMSVQETGDDAAIAEIMPLFWMIRDTLQEANNG